MRLSTVLIATTAVVPQLATACLDFKAQINRYSFGQMASAKVKLVDNDEVKCDFWDQPREYNFAKGQALISVPCSGGKGSLTFATNGKWAEYFPGDGRKLRWDNQKVELKKWFLGQLAYLDVHSRLYGCSL